MVIGFPIPLMMSRPARGAWVEIIPVRIGFFALYVVAPRKGRVG